MKKLRLNEILLALGINPIREEVIIRRVKPDIRKIGNNTLIFHMNKDVEIDYEMFKQLTSCYIITDQPVLVNYDHKDKYIYVKNVTKAYYQFIDYYRNLFNIPVVAVTGTCGKTTTKEMIAQVLKQRYRVVHTISSKNNLRFHHDYLMSFNDRTNFGVFETAITHPGHLIYNCEFFKPSIGIITNIGIDHLNWTKSLNNYIRTKAELLIGLNNQGTLIINNDDENIKKIDFSKYRGQIITFGLVNNSDFMGKEIIQKGNYLTFILIRKGKEYLVKVRGAGKHNVYNALAAIACLELLGMQLEEVISRLEKYVPIRSHTQIERGINGSIIIDDTWSSNPTSMRAALDVLSNFEKDKIKVAILGKISYLGKYKSIFYKQIAKDIITHNIDIVITIDEDAKIIGKNLRLLGMDLRKIIHIETKEELNSVLRTILNQDTVALFKTSMLDKNSQEIMQMVIEK